MKKEELERQIRQLEKDKEHLLDENIRLKETLEKIVQYADVKKPIPDSITDIYPFFDPENRTDLYRSRVARIGAVAEMALDIW